MFYGSTTLATDFVSDDWRVKLLRLSLFFVPKASPDHEKFYPLVKKWYLEIDDNGVPVREIGIDVKGQPLFSAPDKRNLGFWTDSQKAFTKNELDPISGDQFKKLWQEAERVKVVV